MKRTWTMIVLGFLSLWGGAAVASAQTSFRFVMWGGSRGSSSGVDTPIFSANSNQANGLSPKPLFTIFNGDLCYTFDSGCTSTGSSGWKYAINDGSPGNGMFNITFPIEGNHDLNASLWDTYWNGHSRALVTSIGGSNFSYYSGDSQNRTYSFDYSNSHFSLLDNQGGAASSLSSGQISWLDSDIAAAEARGVTHTFITTHGPIWTINSVPDTASSALIAVINKHPSISASLCGHEHVLGYAHIDSSRIRSVTHPWEEFVSGGSGAPLFSCNDNLSEYCISSYGFIVVDVNGSSFTMGIYLHGGGSTPIESWTFTKTTPASLTPTSVSFGSQPVGTTSLAQAITLTNGSGVATSISSIGITGSNSGDFAETNNCGSSLAAGAHCTINVTFTPTAINTRTATLTVTDSATNSPQTASLSGVGTSATATLSPTSLTFAGQAVGTTSAAQPVTLSNTSNATLSISSIALSGDFAQTNNCGSSLAANSSCAINVTFTPTAVGSRTGTLMVTDSASGSPQTVSLSGTGLGPNVTLSPGSLSFSSQDIGTTSSAKTLTLTSSGNQPLSISSIALSGVNAGDFAQSNNCPLSPSTLAASASCTINVTFAPTATGTRSATLAFSDNAPGSPQAVSLSGTGATPQASLTPFAVSFGNQKVGTSSASQTITLSNNVGKRLNISSIAITGTNSGDFRQTNNCGSRLSGQSSCTINVTFTPAAAGARAAALTVTDNASNSPQTASLSGTGTTGTVSLAPSTIPFGNQQVGTTSSPQAATLSNSGGSTVTISSIAITGTNSSNFGQTNNCGASLAAGASCTINVTFSPSVASSEAATLTVTDSDAGSPQTASLTGTGVTGTAALSPTSLTFSSQNVGTTSAAQTVTLTNSGGAA
ncbi:MAG: hypothetical protein DMG21_01985, partial [Acidobacteria bacterium]